MQNNKMSSKTTYRISLHFVRKQDFSAILIFLSDKMCNKLFKISLSSDKMDSIFFGLFSLDNPTLKYFPYTGLDYPINDLYVYVLTGTS